MSADVYRVEVIHYLNPHLIWVEVLDPSNAKDEYVFEQVGLYGILPLENYFDTELEEFKIKKCDNWIQEDTDILKDVFNIRTEVWFSLTYIDQRTSIFDDNIHKYGELLIKDKHGKLKNISKLLIKTNLAYIDENDFHQKLSSGNLNTKLSSIKTKEVLREIDFFFNKYNPKLKSEKENTIKKQTSVFQVSQKFESLLTMSHVVRHNNEMLSKILEQKARDFELCKEVDEESVGCGISYKKRQAAHETFDDIKTFLNTNSKVKHDIESNVLEQDSKQLALTAFLNKRKLLYNNLKQMNKTESDKKENIQNARTKIDETLNTEDEATCFEN